MLTEKYIADEWFSLLVGESLLFDLLGRILYTNPTRNWLEPLVKEQGIYKVFSEGAVVAGKAFREDPEANPLSTETGKIEIYSPYLASLNYPEGIPAIPKYIPEWEGVEDPLRDTYPLLMTTNNAIQRSHSTFHNVEILQEAHHHHVMINTLDAAERGIKNGERLQWARND